MLEDNRLHMELEALKEHATNTLEGLGFPFAISFLSMLKYETSLVGFSMAILASAKSWPILRIDSNGQLFAWYPKPNTTVVVLDTAANVVKLKTMSSTCLQTTINPSNKDRGYVVLIGEANYYISKANLIEAVSMHNVQIHKLTDDDATLQIDMQVP